MAAAAAEPDGERALYCDGYADSQSQTLVSDQTVFNLCSMSKLFAAVTLLRLLRIESLPVDTNVAHFLNVPLSPGVGRGPTVRELLSHHGGVVDPEGAFAPGPAAVQDLTVEDILRGETNAHPGPIQVSLHPGAQFAYSDAGHCLAEYLIEQLSGQDFCTAVSQQVMAPVGQPAVRLGPRGSSADQHALDGQAGSFFARGHGPDGQPVPADQEHSPGRAASGLWADIGQVSAVIGDLARAASGHDASLLPPVSVQQMFSDHGSGAGLGVFTFGPSAEYPVMSQGWGVGFQNQARIDHVAGGSVVVLSNSDPAVPQAQSAVGAAISRFID